MSELERLRKLKAEMPQSQAPDVILVTPEFHRSLKDSMSPGGMHRSIPADTISGIPFEVVKAEDIEARVSELRAIDETVRIAICI